MIVHTSNKLPWQWMKVFVLLFVCLLSFFSLQSTFFFYILFWHRFSINDKSWTVQILLTNKNYISLFFCMGVCLYVSGGGSYVFIKLLTVSTGYLLFFFICSFIITQMVFIYIYIYIRPKTCVGSDTKMITRRKLTCLAYLVGLFGKCYC